MEAIPLLIGAILVFAFGLGSKVLGETVVTAPMAFVAFGLALAPQAAEALGYRSLFGERESLEGSVHLLGEITLVIVLFTDAAQIKLASLRRAAALPLRLLLVGMPLTLFLGAGFAAWLFPELVLFEALLLGAMLAPTDAALGQAVVTNDAVPRRIRQGLSVESGLNDGLAVPMVVVFMSLSAIGQMVGGSEATAESCAMFALQQVTLGPIVGALVGWAGAHAMADSMRRDWMSHSFQELSGVALAIVAFVAAEEIGGNGFISAFVAGLALGNSHQRIGHALYDFAEAESQLLMVVTFLLVGGVLAWEPLTEAPAASWLYAILSLTLLRMLPVALSLRGLHMRLESLAFVGWFGPRGLASVLFAILVLESTTIPHAEKIAEVTILTVVLSVVLHGATAAIWSRGYARRRSAEAVGDSYELEPCSAEMIRKKHLIPKTE